MKAYAFQAALICETCGRRERELLRGITKSLHPEFDESNEHTFDSDYFPKGPYENGGGEADTPQHCDQCGTFLENPLTGDGYAYVRDALTEADSSVGRLGNRLVLERWRKFYGIDTSRKDRE